MMCVCVCACTTILLTVLTALSCLCQLDQNKQKNIIISPAYHILLHTCMQALCTVMQGRYMQLSRSGTGEFLMISIMHANTNSLYCHDPIWSGEIKKTVAINGSGILIQVRDILYKGHLNFIVTNLFIIWGSTVSKRLVNLFF